MHWTWGNNYDLKFNRTSIETSTAFIRNWVPQYQQQQHEKKTCLLVHIHAENPSIYEKRFSHAFFKDASDKTTHNDFERNAQ